MRCLNERILSLKSLIKKRLNIHLFVCFTIRPFPGTSGLIVPAPVFAQKNTSPDAFVYVLNNQFNTKFKNGKKTGIANAFR